MDVHIVGEKVMDRLLQALAKVPEGVVDQGSFFNYLTHKNARAIRGLFGEAEAIARAVQNYSSSYAEVILRSADDWVKRSDYVYDAGDGLVQGVDSIFDLIDAQGKITKLFVEAKNWSSACSSCSVTGLTKQFEKHMSSKVLKEIIEARGNNVFLGGTVPKMRFDFQGSFFSFSRVAEITRKFREACEGKKFEAARAAGFDCSADIDIVFSPEIIHPLVN